MGDPVNLASRIEGLTKEMQATILISQQTASRLDASFVLGRTAMFPVKGKTQPVQVVEVLGTGQAELAQQSGRQDEQKDERRAEV